MLLLQQQLKRLDQYIKLRESERRTVFGHSKASKLAAAKSARAWLTGDLDLIPVKHRTALAQGRLGSIFETFCKYSQDRKTCLTLPSTDPRVKRAGFLNLIHFVWLGKPIYDFNPQLFKNLQLYATISDMPVILWVDKVQATIRQPLINTTSRLNLIEHPSQADVGCINIIDLKLIDEELSNLVPDLSSIEDYNFFKGYRLFDAQLPRFEKADQIIRRVRHTINTNSDMAHRFRHLDVRTTSNKQNYAIASDYYRILIVYLFGGMYQDCDNGVVAPNNSVQHARLKRCNILGNTLYNSKSFGNSCFASLRRNKALLYYMVFMIYDISPLINISGESWSDLSPIRRKFQTRAEYNAAVQEELRDVQSDIARTPLEKRNGELWERKLQTFNDDCETVRRDVAAGRIAKADEEYGWGVTNEERFNMVHSLNSASDTFERVQRQQIPSVLPGFTAQHETRNLLERDFKNPAGFTCDKFNNINLHSPKFDVTMQRGPVLLILLCMALEDQGDNLELEEFPFFSRFRVGTDHAWM
ncbi:hypothetical protein fh0823_20500 [Francisella halioticida]|uniref:glycosyltransferase n=1 Tax=Francisella halioticida TaxID=549298 RepID=UPI001AF57150|nr:glycosyltransferase [Francisella halioticida]BCD91911.1 hypothetical protein fh0823_20500 [Francisella halioticida]